MKSISTESIMPKLQSVVCAGFVICDVACRGVARIRPAVRFTAATWREFSPARRSASNASTARPAAAQISEHGVANVSYRRPSDQREERDNAVLRVKGVEICLAWKQFGGGGDGCYPVSEEAAGRFRLSTGPLWCDISPKF